MNRLLSKVAVLIICIGLFMSAPLWGKIDPGIFKELKPRSIGPANMSGRIAAIDAVDSNPDIIYVGTATGGLWKSINGGITWKPVFDDQPASSIGAVQVFQANPNILWVGTGEANLRNSAGVGRGVFKSLDGGKTWLNLGLAKTEKISRIILHPTDPDTAYVAALGTSWGESPERGVFKTTDGGKTWEKVLYVNEKTGAADLIMEPGNPNKLIAAMWEHRRWPWFFKSGGPGSGLYLTVDGGKNWQPLTHKDGLPNGELGRIGLAFATNKTNVVYALVEAKKDALLRSEDGGYTWKTVNSDRNVNNRPFYYCDIRVNPKNENIVYTLHSSVNVSEDGGKTFKSMASFAQSHSDYHAMWNHPNGDHMIVGNDGGVVITRDRGKNWLFIGNLPLAQYYHISFDMEFPYNVYGGLQDNGSWRGPSTVYTEGGISGNLWRMVGFGDGFDTEPDPQDSTSGYGMSQGGSLYYYNVTLGLHKDIRPTESDVKHRYHWNAALAIDPFDGATIYYGSQFVHRSKDKGGSWEIISPDLTTNDPEKQKQAQSGGLTLDVTAAENHTTILCIAPSPVKQGVIWAGTDDGNVQVTRDNGKSWQLVSKSIMSTKGKAIKKGQVPYGTWAPHVEASKFDAAEAFVVFDDHRRANWKPYVFATKDYGKTWQSLSTNQIDGFAHVIEQDHADPDLLFLGTEFGLYVSFNRGNDWMKWTSGLPTVPVRDMNIHPRENDLVIGTHGRSAYILDDISPLREIDEQLLKKELHLFDILDAYQYRSAWSPAFVSPGDGAFQGKNRTYGAYITFYWNPAEQKNKEASKQKPAKSNPKEKAAKEAKDGNNQLKIEILDKDGQVVRKLKANPQKGINRIAWDLRKNRFKRPGSNRRGGGGNSGGLFVLPGTYTVRIAYGDMEIKKPVIVKSDPRFKTDEKILEKNFQVASEIGAWLGKLADLWDRLENTKKVIETVRNFSDNLEDKEAKKKLDKLCNDLETKLDDFSKTIFRDRSQKGIADSSDKLIRNVYNVYGLVADTFYPITEAAVHKYAKVQKEIQQKIQEANKLYQQDVVNFKTEVQKSGFSLFKTYKPIEIGEKENKKE